MNRNLKFKIQIIFILFTIHYSLFTDTAIASEDFRRRKSQMLTEESFSTKDDVEAEIIFGREVAARILGRYKLYEDKNLTRYINMVGRSAAQYANRPEIEFRFAILNTDIVNAFAAPGGYIFITKGALRLMEDEAELAGVLAHEVAHVSERHIVKELNIKGTEASPSAGLARIVGGGTDTMRAAFTQVVDKAVEILFEKGLKRQDEMDSDRIGTMLIVSAGYDPAGLQRYLKKISTDEKEDTKLLTGTHPPFKDRINNLSSVLTENQLINKIQPVVKERFNKNVRIQ